MAQLQHIAGHKLGHFGMLASSEEAENVLDGVVQKAGVCVN